jgi:DNA-binding HxlR family transcriptional regulator
LSCFRYLIGVSYFKQVRFFLEHTIKNNTNEVLNVFKTIYIYFGGENMNHSKKYSSDCGLNKVQKIVGGKWKLSLLWYISAETRRFGEIKRIFPDITQSMLTKQLRELESDGLLHREIYKEVPPRVEYSLTNLGQQFLPILQSMSEWGDCNLE